MDKLGDTVTAIVSEDKLDLYEVLIDVVDKALEFWEEVPYDFCVQSVSLSSIVFGSVNRVVWTATWGFKCETSHCTDRFIEHFWEVLER